MRGLRLASTLACVIWPLAALAQTQQPDPACRLNGCLRAAQFVGAFAKAGLQPFAEPGVKIDNGYGVYRIRYFTNGREAIATVAVPIDSGQKPTGPGWHIVANNHGTIGIDDACAVSAGPAGVGLAAYFGARGFIGVTADYPGLGTAGLHTYLDKEQEGAAVLDALRATRALTTAVGIRTSGRLAVTGLSQGGHATLSAASMIPAYAPELDIRAFAAAGPASAWEEHWSQAARSPGWHVGIQAMLFYSWSKAYGWKDLPLWTAAMARTVDKTMTTQCTFATSGATLISTVPQDPAEVFDAVFLKEFQSRSWSKYTAVHEAFEKNAIRGFKQTAPIRIYQGAADTIVPEAATRQMVETLKQNGVTVDYVVVPGGEHTNIAFHFLATRQLRTDDALAWLRKLLDKP
jgi:pimeloyl-ACP methyl ester carboxylesterase